MGKRDFFIEEARKVHGDKYDYSKVEYKRAHDKMCIICPKHGEFWQDKFTHLRGCGCPKCGREAVTEKNKFTQEEFISRCKKVWGDKYAYEHTVYKTIMEKIIVTCPEHGNFEVRANDFIRGHGCGKCGGTKKLTTEEFIERAREIHGDKYDYSKVNYVNGTTKICIICPKHGEFWQTPARHLCGDKCPNCFKSFKKTTEQFIEEACKVHGDKYDYSKVIYNGNKKPITIICPKHGPWITKPLSHLQGQGCRKCYEERIGDRSRLTTEEFIKRSHEKHGDKYDYSKVVYQRGEDQVCIKCPEHGEFWQRADKHMQGHGCPKCAEIINGINKRLTTEKFIEKARNVHGNRYDYSKSLYKTTDDYVTIICSKHGEFEQVAGVHLQGNGCPKCNRSRLEETVENVLLENGIVFETQKRFNWLGFQSLDFYLPDYNIAIECQGEQHFSLVELFGGDDGFKTRITLDIKKNKHCLNNGVKILYVVGDDTLLDINNDMYQGIYNNDNVIKISDFKKILNEL